ncbi:DUF3618 domain-containing protein [Actinomycetes bacterium KLBMP 9797]
MTKHKGTSSDTQAIRADVERTREDLGDSVAALAEKADVKARAAEKAAEVKDRTTAKAAEVKDRTTAKAAEVSERTKETAAEAAERAKEKARRAAETAQRRPAPLAGVLAVAATVVGAGVLIRRRRAAKARAAHKRWRWPR